MNKIVLLIIAYLFFSIHLLAQNVPPIIQWQKCYGGTNLDIGLEFSATADGGYILIGGTHSNDGDVSGIHGPVYDDSWVVKIGSTGELEWQKCLGGSGVETGLSIEQTSDGGYIVAALTEYTYDNGDIYGNHGELDVWVAKLCSTGGIEWSKCFGGGYGEGVESIHQTSDGGYILGGSTNSPGIAGQLSGLHGSTSASDAWVLKISSVGDVQCYKCYGGTNSEAIRSLEETSDGGYIFTGKTSSSDGDVSGYRGGNTDVWAVKLDNTGNIQWQKCMGGSGDEEAYSIHQTGDGSFILCGYTYGSNDGDVSGSHGQSDVWVVKLSGAGDIVWQKCLGGTSFETFAISTNQTSDGNYIVAASTQSDDGQVSGLKGARSIWIVKLNDSGVLLWQKCFGGSQLDAPIDILPTSDGGSILLGEGASNDGDISGNHGSPDFWVAKLSPGSLVPLQLISINSHMENSSIITQWQTSHEENVSHFVIERSFDGIRFDSIGIIEAKGNQNTTNYQFEDATSLKTNHSVVYYRLKTVDLDGRYDFSRIVSVKLANHSILTVSPNPAHNILNTKIESLKYEKVLLEIFDVRGKILQRKNQELYKGENIVTLDISSLAKGSYFLAICGDSRRAYKWIKK